MRVNPTINPMPFGTIAMADNQTKETLECKEAVISNQSHQLFVVLWEKDNTPI